MHLREKFNTLYQDHPIYVKQKAKYLLLIATIFLLLAIVLFIINQFSLQFIKFGLRVFTASLTIIISILFGKVLLAQFAIWAVCMTEIPFIIDTASPEIVVVPLIIALTLILVLISSTTLESVLIVIFALGSSTYRIILNITHPDLNKILDVDIKTAYLCLLAIFACLYMVSRIVRSGLRDQELLLKEKLEVIKAYEKMYILRDALKNKNRKIKQIQNMLHVDELTGILNRKALNQLLPKKLKEIKRSNKPVTVTYMDLDYLKYVNDNLGHNSGDDYLKMFADVIIECIRVEDSAFRLGGDEFLIIFSECTREDSEFILSRIEQIFKLNCSKSTLHLPGSFSYGSVDTIEESSADCTKLLDISDRRMLKNKKKKHKILESLKDYGRNEH